jgi:hypothetical protein
LLCLLNWNWRVRLPVKETVEHLFEHCEN